MTAAPASAPYPRQASSHKYWCDQTRKLLHYRRADDPDWEGERNTPLPHPSWLVEDFEAREDTPGYLVRDALSVTQRKLYALLRDIGRGKHNRPSKGDRSKIAGSRNKENDWTVHASHGALASLMGSTPTTVAYNLHGMIAKHIIQQIEVRSRGEGTGKNRVESVYRLPPFNDVLAAIRADPNIATTHGAIDPKATLIWDNGRPNSRKFMTPAQAEPWILHTVMPRPRPVENPEPAPEVEKQAAEIEKARTVKQARRELPAAPPEVVAAIQELCGRTIGNPFTVNATSAAPLKTDLVPAMLAAATAAAESKGKTFPALSLPDVGKVAFGRARQLWRVAVVNERGEQIRSEEMLVWKPDMPAAYLLKCCKDVDVVAEALDLSERRVIKRNREAREKVIGAIGMMRQHPEDTAMWQHGEQISREHPELWAELWAEDDKKHGGDGTGTSRRKAQQEPSRDATRCTPGEWSKASAAAFGLTPKEWPK